MTLPSQQTPGPDHAAPEPNEEIPVRRLNFAEPAVLRGVITAVIALAAALGFASTDALDGAAEGLVPVLAFLVPLIQSLWTRQSVVSPQTHAVALGKSAANLHNGPQV